MDQIYELVQKHGPVTRREIDELLLARLPEILTDNQKKGRIHYYLSVLAREGKIINKGSRKSPRWICCSNEIS